MTKAEMIINILNVHSCLTSKEIANFIWRTYNESFTPASIAGGLRTMYAQGKVCKGKNVKNSTIYWLPKEVVIGD